MKKIPAAIILPVCLMLYCCLKSADGKETVNPAETDIARCREILYLRNNLPIKPLGFKSVYGIRDAVWFKFSTDVLYHNQLFSFPDDSGIGQLKDPGDFIPIGVYWWDVDTKRLFIQSYRLPGRCYMDVGLDEQETETIVYIYWHQT